MRVRRAHDRSTHPRTMRRRLVRIALMTLVLPGAVKVAEALADRLEAHGGPSPSSKALRRGSTLGRRLYRRK